VADSSCQLALCLYIYGMGIIIRFLESDSALIVLLVLWVAVKVIGRLVATASLIDARW
jgi:hypothetical protein